jgi:hypothetical protein
MPQILQIRVPIRRSLRLFIGLLWLAGGGFAVAGDVPLPRPRPPLWLEPQSFREAAGPDFNASEVTSAATECDERLAKIAIIEPIPRLIGPDACGGDDMVQLNAVLLGGDGGGGERVALKPAPVLRCHFAVSLAGWLRDEAAPRVEKLGAPLRVVETYDDFECRGRNRVVGAKLSEHGKGNAVDLRALVLADGRAVGLTDVTVAKAFRDAIRESACRRFTTVLGPGSDGYHEAHIHFDLAERRQGYRMCQWDVREPPATEVAARVPLPQPRPAIPDAAINHERKL